MVDCAPPAWERGGSATECKWTDRPEAHSNAPASYGTHLHDVRLGALVRAFVNVTHDRGRSKIPSHANMARCQRCELGATLSFLGQYVPRTGSREPGPT